MQIYLQHIQDIIFFVNKKALIRIFHTTFLTLNKRKLTNYFSPFRTQLYGLKILRKKYVLAELWLKTGFSSSKIDQFLPTNGVIFDFLFLKFWFVFCYSGRFVCYIEVNEKLLFLGSYKWRGQKNEIYI